MLRVRTPLKHHTGDFAVKLGSTIAGNSVENDGSSDCNGGGIALLSSGLHFSSIANLISTIVAGNFLGSVPSSCLFASGPDIFTCVNCFIPHESYNLIGTNEGVFRSLEAGYTNENHSFVGSVAFGDIPPNLALLANNGGKTQTMAPLENSPAIGNGQNLFGFPFDQRGEGFLRETNGLTDIGAVQTTSDIDAEGTLVCRME